MLKKEKESIKGIKRS